MATKSLPYPYKSGAYEIPLTSWKATSLSYWILVGVRLVSFIPGGGVLPYIGYIGMCRCEGYDFQAVYARIEYMNQSVWV